MKRIAIWEVTCGQVTERAAHVDDTYGHVQARELAVALAAEQGEPATIAVRHYISERVEVVETVKVTRNPDSEHAG